MVFCAKLINSDCFSTRSLCFCLLCFISARRRLSRSRRLCFCFSVFGLASFTFFMVSSVFAQVFCAFIFLRLSFFFCRDWLNVFGMARLWLHRMAACRFAILAWYSFLGVDTFFRSSCSDRYLVTTLVARYVLNTLAVTPSIIPERYLFTVWDFIPSNISSVSLLLLIKSSRLSLNCTSWSFNKIVSCQRTLSLPRKSNFIVFLSILTCSLRSVVAPTVSASSSFFSSPTLMAVRYIR